MLKQKEFDLILADFKRNNMKCYEEWFNENVNCEIKDETNGQWRKGIKLHSRSKKYAVIVIKGFNGIVFRVELDRYIIMENK